MANRKVRSGEDFGFSAAFYNELVDVVDWFKRNKTGSGGAPKPTPRSQVIVSVHNNTGGNLRRGEVVELGDFMLGSVTNEYFWFEGETVTFSENRSTFAITLAPIPDDVRGDALTFGVCAAYVDVSNVDHKYAELVTATKTLKSSCGGPVRILSTPAGTGEQLVLVAMGDGKYTLVGKPDSTISKGSSGTVSIWTKKSGSWADSTFNLSAEALGAECPSAKYCTVQFFENRWLCGPLECA